MTGSLVILSRPSFDFYLPQCTKACSFSSRHGGRCHCGHEVSHAIDIQSGIFSLWYMIGSRDKGPYYTPIAFDERVTFWLQRTGSLPCVCVFAALYACAIV